MGKLYVIRCGSQPQFRPFWLLYHLQTQEPDPIFRKNQVRSQIQLSDQANKLNASDFRSKSVKGHFPELMTKSKEEISRNWNTTK